MKIVFESWKDIEGYEGMYQVSNTGKVKSVKRTASLRKIHSRLVIERLRKLAISKDGYIMVYLNKNGSVKGCYVHRLVGLAFLNNPDAKKEINHIDGNKTNNNITNLEWCTPSENMRHAFSTGLMFPNKGEDNGSCKLKVEDIVEIRKSYETGEFNQYQLADKFKVTQTQIYRIVHRKSWKHI